MLVHSVLKYVQYLKPERAAVLVGLLIQIVLKRMTFISKQYLMGLKTESVEVMAGMLVQSVLNYTQYLKPELAEVWLVSETRAC